MLERCCWLALLLRCGVAGEPVPGEQLWHLLSKDQQHSLSGILSRHAETSGSALDDPEVNAIVSNLLHEELADQEQQAEEDEQIFPENPDNVAEEALRRLAAEAEENRQHLAALEAEGEARHKRLAEQESERDAQRKQMQQEAAKKRAEHEANLKQSEEFLRTMKEKKARADERRAAMQDRQAQNWERASELLQQVHEELEKATDGWKDGPFWDQFFKTSSAATRFSQFGFKHIEAALRAAWGDSNNSVLVVEPSGAGVAARLAQEVALSMQVEQPVACVYGKEGSEQRSLVLEIGLLDAMAMSEGQDAELRKLDALKQAAAKIAAIVKPGGVWLSVSVVPPSLRLPLLRRLGDAAFSGPEELAGEDQGIHTMTIAGGDGAKSAGSLRGSAQVADVLLYGGRDIKVWAYRLTRRGVNQASEDSADHLQEALVEMIRQQHEL